MKPANDLFVKLYFSDEQLNALREIYRRYFEKFMPEAWEGKAVSVSWNKGDIWKKGQGLDRDHSNEGFVVEEANSDPLWQHFKDILPYMEKSAVITKIPPGEIMLPHCDRAWRPEAIYFPIKGCSDKCISEYYDLPKDPNVKVSQVNKSDPPAAYTYAINTHAYLTATHEWHGVKNFSDITRVAFGWNFSSSDRRAFENCRRLLKKLGYTKDE